MNEKKLFDGEICARLTARNSALIELAVIAVRWRKK